MRRHRRRKILAGPTLVVVQPWQGVYVVCLIEGREWFPIQAFFDYDEAMAYAEGLIRYWS